ncbi:TM2 domain-containing protein [Actinoplanes sp. CA-054009]
MTATQAPAATGSKSFIAALLLCFFLGTLGVHRFYVGKVGTGILMLITLGGFGIWTLIDFIMIAVGKFSDKQGLALAR